MKIQHYFLLLAFIIVGVFAALMWLTFSIRPVIFYVTEGALVVVIAYLCFFYRKVIRPIDALTSGMELGRHHECADGDTQSRVPAPAFGRDSKRDTALFVEQESGRGK